MTTLSAAYLASFYLPWRALASTEIPEWIVGYTERIANTLNSQEDLGIGTLGSSLILAVIEDEEGKVSQLCRNSLEANTGSAPKLSILASPGNLISDYEKLVAAMLDRPPTKQPKLILLTYSYRDFFDNLAQSDENASPVAKMLTLSIPFEVEAVRLLESRRLKRYQTA